MQGIGPGAQGKRQGSPSLDLHPLILPGAIPAGGLMKIGGISIILILGIINFLLLLFQLSSGMRWIRVKMTLHRKTGITLLITAFFHGLLAILAD
jgi:hypothetical protein